MSILDTVLSRKQSEALENFQPSETLEALFRFLTTKEQEILRSRHGLDGSEPATLEEIGKRHGVTRERIRQIERAALQKIFTNPRSGQYLVPMTVLFRDILSAQGCALSLHRLYRELFAGNDPEREEKRIIDFFLSQLLKNDIVPLGERDGFRPGWKLKNASLEQLRSAQNDIHEFFSAEGKPLSIVALSERIVHRPFFQEHKDLLAHDALLALLELDTKLSQNPFDEWGLSSWGSIVPRRMYDKIFLVLQKAGKPLHFQEITKRINDAHFDSRFAYAPTVHNELILSDDFVLVGRGMYALRSWGYTEGPVAEVIERILRESNEPLGRDTIVQRVLEQRMVKKNTVHLALSNKEKFSKLADGRYTLSHGRHD